MVTDHSTSAESHGPRQVFWYGLRTVTSNSNRTIRQSHGKGGQGFLYPDGVGDRFPLKSIDSTLQSRTPPL
ncbi:unnamed protein product, partial [Heterotrigona itama]